MKFVTYEDFDESIILLYQMGGRHQKAAEKVQSILGKAFIGDPDPFHGTKMTKHGESRIKYCIKYDLIDYCRLITVKNKGLHILCFVGNKKESEKWLDKNKGLSFVVDQQNKLQPIFSSENIHRQETRITTGTDFSASLLHQRISERHLNRILNFIPFLIGKNFMELRSTSTEDDIVNIADKIDGNDKQNLFYDVFCKLKEGDIEGAQQSIYLYLDELKMLGSVVDEELDLIEAGQHVTDLSGMDPILFEHFIKTANYQKWMSYLHPDQRKLVDDDFSGSAKLVGVSGSGKTSIIVKRALSLSKKYPEENILILTLNKSLASLINELIINCAPEEYRKNIEVSSFWKFCKDKILEFELENTKLYDDITWKTNEHIDDVWAEYIKCLNNNNDAEVLFPVIISLLARNIFPQDYIRQEFDWIRSVFANSNRKGYLDIERQGRSEPFTKEYREFILDGLICWEKKMKDIGVIDYLGIANILYKYIDKISSDYRCVLVDEVQDFGTLELEIIRKLTHENMNDLFLCGDISQQVYTKHHKLNQAGINVSGRSLKLKLNYRNSREILKAAYSVLIDNVDLKLLQTEDFDVMEPDFANFSTPKPLLLEAQSFKEELGYSFNYLKNMLEESQKACIAICGYSLNKIKNIGKQLDIPVLDGEVDINTSQIFLSDLEQTKGFEFDVMCVINCNEEIFPHPSLPVEESYREVCKLYVSMTRAKLSLIISFSQKLSPFFLNSLDQFQFAKWSEHEDSSTIEEINVPVATNHHDASLVNRLDLTGKEFLYTKSAIGLNREVSEKLIALVAGENIKKQGGIPKAWKNIQSLLNDAKSSKNRIYVSQYFGPKTFDKFIDKFDS